MHILSVADRRHRALYDYFDPERWKNVDLIISCGDIDPQYLSFLVTMIPKPLLYVHGNHDTGYRNDPPSGCDSIDDKVVEIGGLVIAGLGGSNWYNGEDMQFTEQQMTRRVKRIIRRAGRYGRIDIVVTHAPPRGIQDLEDMCHRGFSAFRTLMEELRPKVLVHGHNHQVYRKEDRETIADGVRVINAYEYYSFDVDL
ncbi:MAG: metallophosphoesterase family protein [Spirochaetota bacterium]